MNRLTKEKSPYLLQHASNPVDWYPWGEEAFDVAKKQDKPILLSIGYSTCHWCHVMAHESFEDEQIAKMMNEYFVPIKVDREERPDLDHVYMSAVTAMTGQGGWPLTVFLTPDKKPFWGGTYFPPEARYGSLGFKDILHSLYAAWHNKKNQIIQSSNELTNILNQRAASQTKSIPLDEAILEKGFGQFLNYYDSQFGGFGSQPKFPSGHNLSFLLRYWKRTSNDHALKMVNKTLTEMYKGGMYDHIGGGFHRYSTDQSWQVPHFEKMLYDQAILSRTYLEAFQATRNPLYADVTRQIFEYVLRDMRDPQGGFFSAEDADSLDPQNLTGEKKEGAFYLWSFEELSQLLDPAESRVFNYYFGIEAGGNAQFDPHGEFTGKNILYTAHSYEETAQQFNMPIDRIISILGACRQKLFKNRLSRPRPHLDDKVLTDWNGLMIASLALGSLVLNEERFLKAAQEATQFILKKLRTPDGKLLHRFRAEESAITATLSDYAFFIDALLNLYEATFKVEYLKEALVLAETMFDHFWDKEGGGFFLCADDSEALIVRQKDLYDGAFPSGNSIAALDMIRLFHVTLNAKWEEMVQKLLAAFSADIVPHPSSHAQMLSVLDFVLGPSSEIVFVSDPKNPELAPMIQVLFTQFIPNKVVILKPSNSDEVKELLFVSPFLEKQSGVEGKTTVYICKNHSCQAPVSDLSQLREMIRKEDVF